MQTRDDRAGLKAAGGGQVIIGDINAEVQKGFGVYLVLHERPATEPDDAMTCFDRRSASLGRGDLRPVQAHNVKVTG
jgi:hypothetical protein